MMEISNTLVDLIKSNILYILIACAAIIVILFVLVIINMVKMKKLNRKYEAFLRGKDAETLEDTILKQFKAIEKLQQSDKKKTEQIKEMKENLLITYQKTGIVKYDAFKEMGGKLSFAIALLNKENTGFIMNAMHSREGCYTYIKEIIKGESFIVLAEEEKEALEKAMNSDNYLE